MAASSGCHQKSARPWRSHARVAAFLTAASLSSSAIAAGEVTSILFELQPATPFRYTVEGQTFTWGLGDNQIMTGLVTGGERFDYADTVTRVELRRDDISDVAEGDPCGVMVERLDAFGFELAADYPADGSDTGNCDVAEVMASRIVNRGAVDLFSNVEPDAKNIERADFLFDHAVLAPVDPAGLTRAGHAVGEKQGNNPIQIAAILGLDVFGQPSSYGPLVRINPKGCSDPAICFSDTDLAHDYAFFQNETIAPQGLPVVTELSIERVTKAFVSTADLGLSAGQRYYGFSLFADDVNVVEHTLTDPATFPNDTNDDASVVGDDADIHGGLAGYFLADSLSVASGAAFLDADGDGAFGPGDAGLSDISITLHADVNGDGTFDPSIDVALHDPIDTSLDGGFQLPGLPDGGFFVVLDETDPDIPGGLSIVPGINPFPILVGGGDINDVNFVFTNGLDAGGDAGSGDAGAADAGATDAGAADAGAADTGGADTGGADGATDAGATDGADFNDDSVTAAIADTFTINQGETLTAAVLDNDTDAAGGGLNIVSTSQSPNATIEIVGDMIVYTPDFGFFGTDTFVYTIEDANDTQATGTVTVNVERFSDINDNGINDFVECDVAGVICDELRLETGVRGSGIGSLSWLMLAAMLASLSVSLRRSRATPSLRDEEHLS